MAKVAIKGGWVVGWGEDGHQVLEDGIVVTDGDKIAFVGFPDDPDCPAAVRVIDAAGNLVSPGLINLHAIANLDLQVLHIDGRDDSGLSKGSIISYGPQLPLSSYRRRIPHQCGV